MGYGIIFKRQAERKRKRGREKGKRGGREGVFISERHIMKVFKVEMKCLKFALKIIPRKKKELR